MKASQVSDKPSCLVASLERSAVVKGQVRTNSRGGGQTCQIGKGGDPGKGGKIPIPVPLLGFSKRHKQERNQCSAAARRPLPQRGVQPQVREARAGRLQRSPRRRHTKSQNGCPKEARTEQLVRIGETSFCGKGGGGL